MGIGELYLVLMFAQQALYQLICLPNLSISPFLFFSPAYAMAHVWRSEKSLSSWDELSCYFYSLLVNVLSLLKPSGLAFTLPRILSFFSSHLAIGVLLSYTHTTMSRFKWAMWSWTQTLWVGLIASALPTQPSPQFQLFPIVLSAVYLICCSWVASITHNKTSTISNR